MGAYVPRHARRTPRVIVAEVLARWAPIDPPWSDAAGRLDAHEPWSASDPDRSTRRGIDPPPYLQRG